jgi:hypothetical protein
MRCRCDIKTDVLPYVGPDVFLPQLLARCFTTGIRWIVNDGEDSAVAMQECTV